MSPCSDVFPSASATVARIEELDADYVRYRRSVQNTIETARAFPIVLTGMPDYCRIPNVEGGAFKAACTSLIYKLLDANGYEYQTPAFHPPDRKFRIFDACEVVCKEQIASCTDIPHDDVDRRVRCQTYQQTAADRRYSYPPSGPVPFGTNGRPFTDPPEFKETHERQTVRADGHQGRRIRHVNSCVCSDPTRIGTGNNPYGVGYVYDADTITEKLEFLGPLPPDMIVLSITGAAKRSR
jgi:hypothetical protein